jgi:hypothetical protein
MRKKFSMNNYALIVVGALSLLLSGAALAQHSGTEQERRACAGSVPEVLPSDFGSG